MGALIGRQRQVGGVRQPHDAHLNRVSHGSASLAAAKTSAGVALRDQRPSDALAGENALARSSTSVLVGSHATEKRLFRNARRKRAVGSLIGKKLNDSSKRLNLF